MAGRHRATRPSWTQRLAPITSVHGRTKPAVAAGLSGVLMLGLCAATLAPQPASEPPASPVISELAGPLPLRGVDERVSRDAARSDLAVEAEASAAATRLELEREQQRQQAAAKAARVAAVEQARPAGGTPEQNRKLGWFLTLEYGWSAEQFDCFDQLIVSESNWKTTAENPSSGAYGIPQSLPASKMASAGSDWATNPATQIAWGLDYIDDRYGTPCSAWSFKRANNWY